MPTPTSLWYRHEGGARREGGSGADRVMIAEASPRHARTPPPSGAAQSTPTVIAILRLTDPHERVDGSEKTALGASARPLIRRIHLGCSSQHARHHLERARDQVHRRRFCRPICFDAADRLACNPRSGGERLDTQARLCPAPLQARQAVARRRWSRQRRLLIARGNWLIARAGHMGVLLLVCRTLAGVQPTARPVLTLLGTGRRGPATRRVPADTRHQPGLLWSLSLLPQRASAGSVLVRSRHSGRGT